MSRRIRSFVSWLFAAALLLPSLPALAGDRPVLVFAAASLKEALDDVGAAFTAETGTAVKASYAASPALARQIEQGAPADLFVSADTDWMNYLDQRSLLRAGTRKDLLGNRLVLIGPSSDRAGPVALERGETLAERLGGGRLAMADILAVPAGKYGRAALEHLGLWAGVERRIAQAENVRAALLLVSRGEAPLGLVYATDAAADPSVQVLATFPETSHPPIVYPAAILASAGHPKAEAFLAFLSGPTARALFQKRGFSVLAPIRGS